MYGTNFPWDPDLISGAACKFYNFGKRTSFGLTQNWTFVEANYSGSGGNAYNTLYASLSQQIRFGSISLVVTL